CERERHVRAGHARGARAAVSLNDGAIEHDLTLTEILQINRGAQPATDQPTDFLLAATADAAIPRNALGTGRRNHRVLAGDPALTATLQEGRHLFFDRRGAQHPGIAHTNEARGGRRRQETGLDTDRAELVRRAPVGARAWLAHRAILDSRTLSRYAVAVPGCPSALPAGQQSRAAATLRA